LGWKEREREDAKMGKERRERVLILILSALLFPPSFLIFRRETNKKETNAIQRYREKEQPPFSA